MGVDPVGLFERAAAGAAVMVATVPADRWNARTPCAEWNVRQLVDHMAGGPRYLLDALGASDRDVPEGPNGYEAAVARCVAGLREPGALERRCTSPAGFEWSVAEAAVGTMMDQVIHTWDLATALGRDARLDPELVDACVEMFLPHMPEVGRQAGLVGPEVVVGEAASAQERLLGAMGRRG
jgi:uncharacterized protein (TIGR03086 family)